MHAGLKWVYTGMSVSNGECQLQMGHVGFRWVSDQAYWSPMKHVEVFDGSPIRHVGVQCSMSRSLMGLRSSMLVSNEACQVSDGSPIRHVGLQLVSKGSPIIIIFCELLCSSKFTPLI